MTRPAFYLTILLCLSPIFGSAQAKTSSLEQKIRRLDTDAAKAILNKDEAAIDRLFAGDAVTNDPRGGLTIGADGVKRLFKNGLIDYAFFDRVAESVQIHGSTVVVMGHESLAMKDEDGRPGPTIYRRYTNIWMKRGGKWQLTARHASIVCR